MQPDLLAQLEINQAGSCDDSEAPYMPDFPEKLNHPTRFNLEAENLRRHFPERDPLQHVTPQVTSASQAIRAIESVISGGQSVVKTKRILALDGRCFPLSLQRLKHR